jgi:signal transduction histidine kinase
MTERFPRVIPLPGQAGSIWTALLEQIFEDAPLPLSVLDSRGRVSHENAAQQAFNGADGTRLGIGDFNALEDPRAIAGGHAAQFRRALAFETVEYEFEFEEESIRGESICSTYQRLFVPTGTQNGKPTAVISVLIDITDRKRSEREKERLNAQLLHTHKLESLGVLAGGIAHDFNNLLMGVMGNASIVSSKLEQSSPLLKHVHAIEKAARRAADVAQQMLAYAGKGRVERRLVDLSALVSDSSDLLRLSVAGRVELICELAPQLPAVEADVTQLQQVVLNLVTNASEAMEGKSGRVFLRTGTVEVNAAYLLQCFHGSGVIPGLFAYLEVEDSGHGIDAATLTRIFDPFSAPSLKDADLAWRVCSASYAATWAPSA